VHSPGFQYPVETNRCNENNIKSLRINNHVTYNQISIANELNNYFLNIAGSINNNKITEKEVASPIQYLLQYFNQPFKDISCVTPPQKK